MVIAVTAERVAFAGVRKLRAGYTAFGGQGSHLGPLFGGRVVAVHLVVDVRAVVAEADIDHAVDAKLVRMVPLARREIRLLAPRIGRHVVLPPIVHVPIGASTQSNENFAVLRDEGRVGAGCTGAGSLFGPLPCRRIVHPEVIEVA